MTDHNPAANHMSGIELRAISEMSYEEARDRLVEVVRTLEAGGLDIDSAMKQWELGEALARHAQKLLDDVYAKLNTVQENQQQAGQNAGTQGNLE